MICFRKCNVWIARHIKITKPVILAGKVNLFVVYLLTVNDLDYIASNDGTTVDNELPNVWYKATVAQFIAPYWHLLLGTADN
jgi:membrane-associated PAP2 superfamily phosphatase